MDYARLMAQLENAAVAMESIQAHFATDAAQNDKALRRLGRTTALPEVAVLFEVQTGERPQTSGGVIG